MAILTWLKSLALTAQAGRQVAHKPVRYRPQFDVLEGRQMPSTFSVATFSVVLTSDAGGAGGQQVTATSGDLRYCIAQANAKHSVTSDTILFAPGLFATPQTIVLVGSLVVNDSHSLNIQGPAGGATISGGDKNQVIRIARGNVGISNLTICHGSASAIENDAGATLTLANCMLDHDTAIGDGGGLANSGKVFVKNCIFSRDVAASGGGGAVANWGSASLTGCTIDNCSALLGGGFANEIHASAALSACILSNDSAKSGSGGGLDNLGTATLLRCAFPYDSAGSGGGISTGAGNFSTGATLALNQCILSGDTASSGGGIYNTGPLTVKNSTLNNDSANQGGGICNVNSGALTLSNCTLSNDTAGNIGGGIVDAANASASLTNCTLSNNSAAVGGGINTGGVLNLTNTILSGNTAPSGPDISGPVTTADHDLIGDGSGSSGIANGGGNLVGTSAQPIDPRLSLLQNNTGQGYIAPTLALLPGSPAIGKGDNAKAPATDQRGIIRFDKPQETTDIGAFEL
jgi:hypothetical protein